MMTIEHNLANELDDIRNLNAGTLRLGASNYINSYILAPILSGFSSLYPNLNIELYEDSGTHLAEMLEAERLDIMFTCNRKFIRKFKKYPAYREHIILGVPCSLIKDEAVYDLGMNADDIMLYKHLDNSVKPIDLLLFKDTPFLLIAEGDDLHDRSMEIFNNTGFNPYIKLQLAQMSTAFHMCENGIGATFVSDRQVFSMDTRTIRYYKVNAINTTRLFYMLHPDYTYSPHAMNAFIKYFQEHARLDGFDVI